MIYVLFLIIAVCKGVSDALKDADRDGWLSHNWRRKYNMEAPRRHWWYLGLYKPKISERFPFSSTALVFITDAWHFFNFIKLRAIFILFAMVMDVDLWYGVLHVLITMPVIHGILFEIVYNKMR